MTRRGFLKWLIAGFGVVSLAGVLYPITRFLKPPVAVSGAIGQVTNVGALGTFPAGQLTPVAVNGQPAAVQNLNGKYTVFGKVTAGMDVADKLTPRDPSTDPNAPPGDKILEITIQEH